MNAKWTLTFLFTFFLSFGSQAYDEEELTELSALFMEAVDPSTETRPTPKLGRMSALAASNATPSTTKFMTELALSRMEVKEQITPETTELFGDKIDLNTGSVMFQQTDLSLKGNSSLPVSVSRTYRGSKNNRGNNASFGDWVLDIPSISTTTLEYQPGLLSFIPSCTSASPNWVDTGFATVGAMQYWSGTTIEIPGVTSQKIRMAYGSGGQQLQARFADNWKISCLTNRYGFEATSPEGTVYTFDVIRLVPSSFISVKQEAEYLNPNYDAAVLLRTYTLNVQVSQIRDRFNNTVNFEYESSTLPYGSSSQFLTYSNKLTRIYSSDGRQIVLEYEAGTNTDRVARVIAGDRVWSYRYESMYDNQDAHYKDVLKEVVRPDSKKWEFNIKFDTSGAYSNSAPTGDCLPNNGTSVVSTIKHPEGAIFRLTQRMTNFGRTSVPFATGSGHSPWSGHHNVGRCISNLAIIQKELQFNSNSTVWNYSYSQNAGSPKQTSSSLSPQPAVLSGIPITPSGHALLDLRSTSVSNPDGSKTTHVFNRKFGVFEGKEVLTLYYDTNNSTLLQAKETSYISAAKNEKVRLVSCKPTQYPVFELESEECNKAFDNEAMYENHVYPSVVKTTLYSNGSTTVFNTTYGNYNLFGKPQLLTETGVDGTRYKRLSYLHDTSLWVLNLPTKTEISANNSTWTTESETSYYAASSASKLLPYQQFQFGALTSTNSYHLTGDSSGNLKRQTFNASNRWIEFNSYKRGIPQHIVVPDRYVAATTLSAYQVVNDFGEITSTTNFKGHSTSYSYDNMGRLTTISPPSPWLPTSIEYTNFDGRFIQTIIRGNYEKRIEMDALLRPLRTRERDTVRNQNIYVNQQYDVYNQPVFTSFPSDHDAETEGTSQEYDGLQRLKRNYSTVDNTGVDYYYLTDNRVETVDSLGNRTTVKYRAFGLPEQKLPTQIVQPEGVTTTLAYNIFDNPTSITQGGLTESRFYNAQQRLCRLYRPDVGATAYEYDALGNVIWEAAGASGTNNACSTASVLASEKTNITYDYIGNIRQITFPDSSGNIIHSYDAQGNLVGLTSGSTAWEYEYTSQGKLGKETLLVDNLAFVLTPTYNSMEQITSLMYPSGRSVYFTVDAFGRTLSSGSYATNAQYHPNGQLSSFNYGNSLTFSQTLDNHLRPELRQVNGAGNLLSHQYSYDSNNNLTSIIDAVSPTHSITNMSYDGLDRLKTATSFWGVGSFNYDVLGNITRKTLGAQNISYSYNTSNRLTGISGSLSKTFSYDSRGNVTSNGAKTFTYNRANRLASSGGTSYVYDGHGRRIIKNKNGVKTYSFYSNAGVLIGTYENNGYTDYYYLGKQLVAKYADPNTQSDKPGYTGHVEDNDLQLTYMQQRYYDPVIGRFYSNDPVGFVESQPSSFGRYTYANNNPYKYVDPDGRWGIPGAIYGAIAGATGGFVASGSGFKSTVIGTLAGAAAGAAVGAVAPQTSHMAGLAVAGAVASAGGQAAGSVASAAVEKGVANVTAADINVDPVTTALGGVGAGVGGVVGKGVSQMTMRPIVGQTLDKAGTPTVAGMVAGSVTEGAVIGGAEKLAPKVSETLNKVDEQLNK